VDFDSEYLTVDKISQFGRMMIIRWEMVNKSFRIEYPVFPEQRKWLPLYG
jgi:hypothetical protein